MIVVASLDYLEVMDDGDIGGWVQLSMNNGLRCVEGDEVVCDKPELETMTMSLINAGVWAQV
jgi:hypothetical protein